jgi:hypothetical protein
MTKAEEVELDAEGVSLRGQFFPPDGGKRQAPCVVMSHGHLAPSNLALAAYETAAQPKDSSCWTVVISTLTRATTANAPRPSHATSSSSTLSHESPACRQG